ncbi:MAG: LacI family DNA-binding transcriptional regulator [Lachnospiraceae bacterium]|nr:LacI family DNA-binding transcriptional regulator [Lachnospiraceae bacterium]
MITIKQIAKELNMSATTVSNVIHGKTKEVSQETIERVKAYLSDVEYVPNINARNLAQNQSKMICVVLRVREDRFMHILSDPFVSEMLGGIEEVVRAAGYYMMICISEDISEIITKVETWNADGLILFCMLDDDALRIQRRYRKPIACVDAYVSDEVDESFGNDYVNVGLDDEGSVCEAVKYLINKGHKKIGFLTDNIEGVNAMRFKGYRRALKEEGIKYSRSNLLMLESTKRDINRSLEKMIRLSENMTAVFCCSDLYATMLMGMAQKLGKNIPDDLSIMGVDDILISRICTPKLTTIHQSAEDKGKIAAEKLLAILKGKDVEERQIILPHSIVERESVKDLREIVSLKAV